MSTTVNEVRREEVRAHYAAAATAVSAHTGSAGCCGSGGDSDCGCAADAGAAMALYAESDRDALPDATAMASLGCGNPLVVADLRPGETVLDLGSGGGVDVLLSARRVGPGGFAYGLDMTDEMLDLARRNAAEAGAGNVEFLKGDIEAVPLADASVDVVVSNCVINLSVDKRAVFEEMFRVLRPGGRIGITDVVADDALSGTQRAERGSYSGCVAGALSFGEYRAGLEAAGFAGIAVEPTHAVTDGLHSAIVRAVKPS